MEQKNKKLDLPFEGPYKTKPSAVPGKHGIGFSTARHLARQGMAQQVKKAKTNEDNEQGVAESVDYKGDAETLKKQGNIIGYHKTMVRHYDTLADNAGHRTDAKRYEALSNKHHAASKGVVEGLTAGQLVLDPKLGPANGRKPKVTQNKTTGELHHFGWHNTPTAVTAVTPVKKLSMLDRFRTRRANEDNEQGVAEGHFSDQDVQKKDKQYAGTKAYHANKKAEKEMDSRHAEGEDMTGAKIDKKTYQIVKPKKPKVNEAEMDPREYDYEGDMAKSQLKSIIMNAQQVHDMLEDDTNMAEWVQSKITLAADYISTVADYMQSEVNEAVNEAYTEDDIANGGTIIYKKARSIPGTSGWSHHISKVSHKTGGGAGTIIHTVSGHKVPLNHVVSTDASDWKSLKEDTLSELKKSTLGSYAKKAKDEMGLSAMAAGAQGARGERIGRAIDMAHAKRRSKGLDKAITRLTKEEVEPIDELSKDTIYSYAKKSEKDQDKQFNKISIGIRDKDPKSANTASHKFTRRSIGQGKAENRLNTESFKNFRAQIAEKHLTPAEMKKREEIAKAIHKENPGMPMGNKMAIATASAKKAA